MPLTMLGCDIYEAFRYCVHFLSCASIRVMSSERGRRPFGLERRGDLRRDVERGGAARVGRRVVVQREYLRGHAGEGRGAATEARAQRPGPPSGAASALPSWWRVTSCPW